MKLFNKQTTLIVFDSGSWLFNSLAFLDWGEMASCGGDGGDGIGRRLHGKNIKEISRDHSNAVWAFQF